MQRRAGDNSRQFKITGLPSGAIHLPEQPCTLLPLLRQSLSARTKKINMAAIIFLPEEVQFT